MTNATGSVSALIDAGDLQGAVSAALSVVKQRPTDGAARRRLIDLLIVSGDFERADKQADILSKTIPDMMVGLALLRGRLRAADARAAWFETGAVPAFPDGPSANDQLAMKNALAIGGGPCRHQRSGRDGLSRECHRRFGQSRRSLCSFISGP